jgi:hypothetical protein
MPMVPNPAEVLLEDERAKTLFQPLLSVEEVFSFTGLLWILRFIGGFYV